LSTIQDRELHQIILMYGFLRTLQDKPSISITIIFLLLWSVHLLKAEGIVNVPLTLFNGIVLHFSKPNNIRSHSLLLTSYHMKLETENFIKKEIKAS